jgi:lysophospholipase L1-like esterase
MGFIVAFVSLLVTLVAAEGLFLLARYMVKGGPQSEVAEIVDDPELGWTLNPDRKRLVRTNSCGETITRDPPPSRYLAKTPSHPEGTRVLFLGDSFTHAHEVSTGAAYYDVFERETIGRYAVFAAGIGGYGTAQQFLLLKRLTSETAPQIVIWQLCTNDVAENVFAGADPSTVQKARPYLELASDAFRSADPSVWLFKHSELAKFTYGQLARLDRAHSLGLLATLNRVLPSHAKSPHEVEREGLEVLSRLVDEAKRMLPGVRIVGFAADREFDDKYAAVFRARGLEYWPGVAAAVAAQRERTDCAPLDMHWNHAGNMATGRILAQQLLER